MNEGLARLFLDGWRKWFPGAALPVTFQYVDVPPSHSWERVVARIRGAAHTGDA